MNSTNVTNMYKGDTNDHETSNCLIIEVIKVVHQDAMKVLMEEMVKRLEKANEFSKESMYLVHSLTLFGI